MLPTQSILSFLLRISINQRVRTRNKKCSCQVMWRELNKETIYKGVRGMQEDPAMHLPGTERQRSCPSSVWTRHVVQCSMQWPHWRVFPGIDTPPPCCPLPPISCQYTLLAELIERPMTNGVGGFHPDRPACCAEARVERRDDMDPTEHMFNTALHTYVDRQTHIHTFKVFNFILVLPRWH